MSKKRQNNGKVEQCRLIWYGHIQRISNERDGLEVYYNIFCSTAGQEKQEVIRNWLGKKRLLVVGCRM